MQLNMIDDQPRFDLNNNYGKLQISMAIVPQIHIPALFIYDSDGRGRITLGLDDDKNPYFELNDDKGTPRAVLGTTELKTKIGEIRKRPVSSLILFDENRKVVWQAP